MLEYFITPVADIYESEAKNPEKLTLEDLKILFSTRETTEKKDGVPLFSPARFVGRPDLGPEHTTPRRRLAHAHSASCLVLDLDEGTAYDIDKLKKAVLDNKILCLAYTSHSHTKAKPKWRFVFPLDVPVPGWAYRNAMHWFLLLLGSPPVDGSKLNVASIFYLPSCPEATKNDAEFLFFDGSPLVLPSFEAMRKNTPHVPLNLSAEIDWPFLRERLRTYRKDPDLRGAFRKVLDGQAFAEKGGRDTILTRMCGVLAYYYPRAEAAQLATLFAPSLEKMQKSSDDAPTIQNAIDKIERSQSGFFAQAGEAAPSDYMPQKETAAFCRDEASIKKETDEQKKELAEQVPAPEIVPAQTPENAKEIESFFNEVAQKHGCTPDQFKQRLILSTREQLYYVFAPYKQSWAGPCKETIAKQEIYSHWPSFVPGFTVMVPGAKGEKHRTFLSMLVDYGSNVEKYEASFVAERSNYEPRTRTFTEALCPIRKDIQPQYSSLIDRWLRMLGGDNAEKFLDWCASVPDLNNPTAALWLRGSPGVGKGLFVRGVARLWNHDSATPMADILGNFNEALADCPVVVMDEVPPSIPGLDITGRLRQMVTSPADKLRRKFLPPMPLRGYLRIILTSNNFDLLVNNKVQARTIDDLNAVSERVLEIEPSDEARRILESLSRQDRDALASEDHLSAHLLWLAEVRKESLAKVNTRFAVMGDRDGDFARRLITSDGKAGAWVAEWLTGYLSDPITIERDRGPHVERNGITDIAPLGEVRISSEVIANTFEVFVQNDRKLTAFEVSRALAALALRRDPEPFRYSERSGFIIDVQKIYLFALENGLGKPKEILKNAQTTKLKLAKSSETVYTPSPEKVSEGVPF